MAEHDETMELLARIGQAAVPAVQVPLHTEVVPVLIYCQAGSQIHAAEIIKQALSLVEGETSVENGYLIHRIP